MAQFPGLCGVLRLRRKQGMGDTAMGTSWEDRDGSIPDLAGFGHSGFWRSKYNKA